MDVDVILLCLNACVYLSPGLHVERQPDQDVPSCLACVALL